MFAYKSVYLHHIIRVCTELECSQSLRRVCGFMARATYGQLKAYEPDAECITAYLERTDLFFAANDIAGEKKVPVLLSAIGVSTYALLRNLVTPELQR